MHTTQISARRRNYDVKMLTKGIRRLVQNKEVTFGLPCNERRSIGAERRNRGIVYTHSLQDKGRKADIVVDDA